MFHRSPNTKTEAVDTTPATTSPPEPAPEVVKHTPEKSHHTQTASPQPPVIVTPLPEVPTPVPSVSTGNMFEGMSAATTPKTTEGPIKAPVSSASPPAEISPTPAPRPVDTAPAVDICSEIKILAGDVVSAFDKQSTDLVNRFQFLVTQLSNIRATLLSYERNERISHQKLKDMEAEQVRLGEIEDFESADALTHVMENLRNELEAQSTESKELRKTLVKYEEEIVSLNDAYSRLLDSSLRGLKNLRRQQSEEVDAYFSKLEAKVKEDNSRVAAEEERLALEWQHVEREESALAEESETIEHAIASQTKEHQESKSEMDMRLLGVTSEIRNLEKALAEKRAEEKALKEELRNVEQKINDVRKKYDRQLLRINDRTVALSAVQQECRKEEETIRREREAVNATTEKITSSKRELTDWMAAMDADVAVMAEVMESFALGRSLPVTGVVERSVDAQLVNPELESLRKVYIEAEASLQEAVTQQKELESTKVSLLAENNDIDAQIPQLEADKKEHASNKRFKEAAEVVKTIKQLTSRKEEIAALLEDASGRANQISLTVNERQSSLVNIENEIKECEKASDMQKLALIRTHMKSLKKFRSQLMKKYHSSGGTLLESNLRLINAELTVLVQAGAAILDKHDMPNEDVNMEDDVEEEEEENVSEGVPDVVPDDCTAEEDVCAQEANGAVAPDNEAVEENVPGEGNGDVVDVVEPIVDDSVSEGAGAEELPKETVETVEEIDESALAAERHTRMLEAKVYHSITKQLHFIIGIVTTV